MSILEIVRLRAALKARVLVHSAIARRFNSDQRGVAAVEFAMIAMPFMFILFMIIEIALVFFAGQILETAATDASRLIMTGQSQSANFDAARFKNEVCSRAVAVIQCSGINVDVQTYASFGGASTARPAGATQFNQGTGGQIVVVRVFYEWTTVVPSFGMVLGDLPNGNRLLLSTVAFRNEPF
ncbi:MAG: TadE/TadG family type IV pilus assembly protein [Alphaproteobacteria bacterium]